MTFEFTCPGQPPSMNTMYVLARYRGVPRIVKAAGVETYQLVASHQARSAKPAGWQPGHRTGLIRVQYWFHLQRNIDSDNAMKALNDAIAKGIGYDDKFFLPQVMFKEWGVREPHVRIRISDYESPSADPDVSTPEPSDPS